jgi:simple sugar transport system substrate-binding protein
MMKKSFHKMLVLELLFLSSMLSCGGEPQKDTELLKVGFIYVGPRDDYGYNQAHAEGASVARGLSGVQIIEQEKVAETVDVQKAMEGMIEQDGVKVIFATSFGYFDPHVVLMAKKYPDVIFFHCGGLYQEGVHPKNIGSYFGYIDEGQYLNGMAAGYVTKTNKLGFIAAKPIAQVLRNINAFTLGAKSVNPNITTTVIFTGDWSLPVAEANATNSLVDQGIDVITMHVDSPKVIVQEAEKRGIFVAGYHANQSVLAPKGYLTGAEWNWGAIYSSFIEQVRAGNFPGNFVRGGMKDGFVKMSPFGPALSDQAKTNIEQVKAQIMQGNFVIFKGPLYDNKKTLRIPGGVGLIQTDPILETMDYLIEGVIGSTGL